jgi:DNA-binding Lrp family transcriptional regulator
MRLLPTLRLFKIGVKFDLGADAGDDNVRRGAFTEADRAIAREHELSLTDRRLVLALQQDLPLVPRPFDGWAEEADCTTGELLAAANRFLERRQMRRFSAVLHHRKAGVVANVMAVWAVDPGEAAAIGERMAQFDAVSHCYLRPRYEDWPYNLFTMVHARSKDEALATLARMQETTGIAQYQPLWTLREFKKVRLRYFTDEIATWESRQG